MNVFDMVAMIHCGGTKQRKHFCKTFLQKWRKELPTKMISAGGDEKLQAGTDVYVFPANHFTRKGITEFVEHMRDFSKDMTAENLYSEENYTYMDKEEAAQARNNVDTLKEHGIQVHGKMAIIGRKD